ncbi:hypothetical protein NL108_005069, partial [Boleophthalmus pectinirostris]
CRYVAVDLAGHGLSSHRPPGVFYTFPSYVVDVCRVVKALQWDRFSIIGHSMGDALYPEMVDAVVLLDSFGFLPTDQKEIAKAMKQGIEELLMFEKKSEEKKEKIYTYEEAVKRLLEANPTLSNESVQILLERGLVKTDGGVLSLFLLKIILTFLLIFAFEFPGFTFSRDFRINLKNIVRISLEQSLEMQSRIQATVLVILAEDGFEKMFSEEQQKKFSALLQGFRDRN